MRRKDKFTLPYDIFTDINLALVIIGATVLLPGTFSNLIERLPVSEPLLELLIGIIIGIWFNSTAALADPGAAQYKVFIEELARITLAISLMGVALRLLLGFFFRF